MSGGIRAMVLGPADDGLRGLAEGSPCDVFFVFSFFLFSFLALYYWIICI
jgi:hypothetical protein